MKLKLVCILLFANLSIVYSQFGGGNGTEGSPYQISTAEHLASIANNINESNTYSNTYFILMNDINLTSYLSESGGGYNGGSFWLPIGNGTYYFNGKFDGNGRTIYNLKINRSGTSYIGLFGFLGGGFSGEIKNLVVTIDASGSVKGYQTVGGLIGFNQGTITNCSVSGNVEGVGYVGGFVGLLNGFIRRCSSSGTVTATNASSSRFGGFIGSNSGTIENSFSRSNVSAAGVTYVGGFAGENLSNITNSYSTGFVDATTSGTVGGFLGYYQSGTITKCFWDTQTSGKESSQGTDVTGKTTAQMKTNTTFLDAGWDAAIWNIGDGINDGYPYLDWQNTGGTPLPMELTSFSAEYRVPSVELKWQTATEVNNYGFSIERRVKSEEWKAIAFVAGNGNSNSPKSYSFVDANQPSGKIEYRLKQIDFDGKYEYSDIVEINIDTPAYFVLHQNHPNPFNPETTISYTVQAASQVSLKVHDVLGREVATLVNEFKQPGVYNSTFYTLRSSLPSGIYFYMLKAGSFTSTKKMTLLK
ncbi:MAG: GLUG motif-containing protein [Melioribacteraceae bacterium]